LASSPYFSIVFVHGITGHREDTWSAGEGFKPWPETLLPLKIPHGRILSFGYDATVIGWRSRISNNNIGDHAKNLLAALANCRDADNSVMNLWSPNDPLLDLILIILRDTVLSYLLPTALEVSSVKMYVLLLLIDDWSVFPDCQLTPLQALLASRATPEIHLRRILESTYGILFLGTPHSGTGLATVAKRLAQIMPPSTGTNLRIVKVLQKDSEVLARIQNEFHSLLRSRRQEGNNPIEITCFYEEVPISGIGEVSGVPISLIIVHLERKTPPPRLTVNISSCKANCSPRDPRLYQNTLQFSQDTPQLGFIATIVIWRGLSPKMIQDL
jgi:hypothetical protein